MDKRKEAPRREPGDIGRKPDGDPGDDAGRFGVEAAVSPGLRMGAFMRRTIQAPRREPGDDAGCFGVGGRSIPLLAHGGFYWTAWGLLCAWGLGSNHGHAAGAAVG